MTKRNYELMLVLSPELDESALETLVDRIKGFLDTVQAEVLSFKSWGLRRMAYVIRGHREGRYYLVHFTGESENCSELERSLILSEDILRHLLTHAVKIPIEEPEVVEEEPEVVADVAVKEPEVESEPTVIEEETTTSESV